MVARGAVSVANRRRRLALRAANMYPSATGQARKPGAYRPPSAGCCGPRRSAAPGHRRARQPGRLAAAAEEGSSPRQHSPGSAAVHDSGGMPDPAQAAADIVPHRNPLSGTGGSNPALSSGESVANSVIAKAGPCGTTASVFTFLCLRELRDELHGRLTLSAVSQMRTAASDDASASCNALNQPDPL